MARLAVELLPVFSDNYIYLVREPESGAVAVVDPGADEPVAEALAARGWGLNLVLCTHHHSDHVGGAGRLAQRFGAEVVGPASETIAAVTRRVRGGDSVALGDQAATVIDTPGHTAGHIAYWFRDSEALFCGDTLFALGCGRLFEGTAAQLWTSLGRLRDLPDETRVYCGHEYTEANARFALTVEPDNADLRARAGRITELRRQGLPTIPSLLGEEKRTNPFLRADIATVQAAMGMPTAYPVAVFAEIRQRKDHFRG